MRNDLTKLDQLAKAGVLPSRPGTLQHIYIEHDDACPILAGHPECNCDPDIRYLGKKLKLPRYN